MNKLLITGCLLATAIAAVAMPTKKELAAAQKRIEDVIAPDVKALNAGRKTVKDVADVQMKLAADAQSEVEKYLLLQSAFKLYSRGEEFDSAAKALTAISRDVKDVPPELITELVDKEFGRDMGLKAPKEIVAAERAMQRQRLVATQKEKEKTRKIRPTLGGLRRSDQLGARRLQRQQEAQTATQLQATVDGYTWSYRVNNGEATISSVSPKPMGDVSVPSTLGGVNVTSIGRWAFSHCDRMKSLIIPEGMTSIGLGAFTGCSQLASLALPQSLKSIEDYAFFRCGKLTAVMIPKGLTTAGDGVFAGCSELVEINVEEGSQCFMSVDGVLYSKDQTELVMCPVGIASVTVPSHVRKIRLGAFLGFGKLMQIHVEADNPMYSSVDGMLCTKDKTSLLACPGGRTSVTIPMGVVHISRYAFWWGEGLVSVTIPQSVSDVGTRAFAVCKRLVSIAIPSSVTSIGDLAFEGCDGLTSVTMCGEKPNFQGKVFSNCKNLKFIHVPAKAKSWAGMKEWQGIPLVFDAEAK